MRLLVNKNQLKKQILQKELQIKKLHLHQSSTEFCNQLYNTLILEKAILKKELENLEKNHILEKIKKTFSTNALTSTKSNPACYIKKITNHCI